MARYDQGNSGLGGYAVTEVRCAKCCAAVGQPCLDAIGRILHMGAHKARRDLARFVRSARICEKLNREDGDFDKAVRCQELADQAERTGEIP